MAKRANNNDVTEILMRIVILIVDGIIFYFWNILTFVLFIINFIISLFSGKPNPSIISLSKIWLNEITRALRYILFISDERPFPFNALLPENSK